MLSAQEISDLKDRCKYADAHGFQIGLAEQYVAELDGTLDDALPRGIVRNSAAHILHLIDSAADRKTVPVDMKALAKSMRSVAQAEIKAEAEVKVEATVEAVVTKAATEPPPAPPPTSKRAKKESEPKDPTPGTES